jgi:hypothetical protein
MINPLSLDQIKKALIKIDLTYNLIEIIDYSRKT